MRIACKVAAALCMFSFRALQAADAQGNSSITIKQPEPRVKSVRVMPVRDSLEADMLGLLARAEQGRAGRIKGEYYVPDSPGAPAAEIGQEDRKKLQTRLIGTSFKLKLEETKAWVRILADFDKEVENYFAGRKGYKVLKSSDTAIGGDYRTISAALRLTDTVYVWTPGCNCPKPKSSALATCAVVLEARATDEVKRPIWGKREVLFYVGLEESMEEAFSIKRMKKYVRNVFGSFK